VMVAEEIEEREAAGVTAGNLQVLE
jgi:hypothetical protein